MMNEQTTQQLPPPPKMQPCPSGITQPPKLPTIWKATTLMFPFKSQQMVIGDIEYDWELGAMYFGLYGFESGKVEYLVRNGGIYHVKVGDTWYGPYQKKDWQLPPPDFLSNQDVTCMGVHSILDVSVTWWIYQYEYEQEKTQKLGNWFWYRTDNGYPWRMMSVNENQNPLKLPILAAYSMIFFPDFAGVETDRLADLANQVEQEAKAITPGWSDANQVLAEFQELDWSDPNQVLAKLQDLETPAQRAAYQDQIPVIPGLGPCNVPPDKLPVFPDAFYATAIMTSINRQVLLPTDVLYDWHIQRQRTRMYYPEGYVIDAILTGKAANPQEANKTFQVKRWLDEPDKYDCEGVSYVGIPYPNWKSRACLCHATLTNGPLSPSGRSLILRCEYGVPNSVFWTWYSPEGIPILFWQTNPEPDVGTSLALADYYDFVPNIEIEPSDFTIPQACIPAVKPFTFF